jgi:transposase-like protein
MRLTRRTVLPVPARSAFAGFRFPPEVIVLAVRRYLRFGLSYRDVEEAAGRAWHRRRPRHRAPVGAALRAALVDAARFARHRVGDPWHVAETYVKVAGRSAYLSVDQYGQLIDVYASTRRDGEAARRFFHRARISSGVEPTELVTDRAWTYPRVLDQVVRAAWHPRRALRQQPGRSRPRAAETSAACDARDQDHDRASGTRRGPRLRAEPAPRTLRDRRQRACQPSTSCRIRPLSEPI